jgi:hypothetical protein
VKSSLYFTGLLSLAREIVPLFHRAAFEPGVPKSLSPLVRDRPFLLSLAREIFPLFHRPWPVKSALACGINSLFQQAAYFTRQLRPPFSFSAFARLSFSMSAFQRFSFFPMNLCALRLE